MDPYWQLLIPRVEALGLDPQSLRRRSSLATAEPWERVFVCEKEPVKFLESVFAAIIQGCSVWFGDPGWGTRRINEALDWIRPQHVFGSKDLAVSEYKSPDASYLPIRRRLAGAPGIFIPSGGSSGGLKFAVHSWDTLAASAVAFHQFFKNEDINACCVLPVFHVSGFMQVVRSIMGNGDFFIRPWKGFLEEPPDFSPEECYLSLVPLQLRRLMENSDAVAQLKRFRMILLGGAKADKHVLEEAFSQKLPVVCSYGATETAAVVSALPVNAFMSGKRGVGIPLPHANIQCLTNDLNPANKKTPGCIQIKSSSLCHGYFPGGVFYDSNWETNDVGYFDEDGYLQIVGRLDRTIVSGGEKIDPYEVEQALLSTLLVRDVYVCGKPDEEWGEHVCVYCVPEGAFTSVVEIEAELRGWLAPWQMPKEWHLLSNLPRSEAGKIIPSALGV